MASPSNDATSGNLPLLAPAAIPALLAGYNTFWSISPAGVVFQAPLIDIPVPVPGSNLPVTLGTEVLPLRCIVSGAISSSSSSSDPSTGSGGPGATGSSNRQTATVSGGKRSMAGKKTKRPPSTTPKKANGVLEWSIKMVRDLMSLRYEAYSVHFGKAKNNAALKEAWLLLATELRDIHKTPISSEQCKNKLKWLKRKWAEYNEDIRATRNGEEKVQEPPGLELMQESWAASPGMNAQTLANSEADGAPILSDEENGSGDKEVDQSAQKSGANAKKHKTMGDSFEIGVRSIADGFQAMAAVMAPPSTAPSVTSNRDVVELIDTRFHSMMQRQDDQLAQMKIQNQHLATFIEALQHGSGN